MIPCKDCITLALCKSAIRESSLNFYSIVVDKCSLIRDYMHIEEYYSSWFRFDPVYNHKVADVEKFYKLRMIWRKKYAYGDEP